ncbi:N-acetyltransferase domain-containing protein [Mycena sanguinolenta]|uniref:N-acetyltransferase domain-containing protein n=1 Tax=Mycena sanguinolenta TaxID=230812 RepID=A0A8H6ZFI9_9AGAR|nr:N-acetyltransferase domain-containing protein [Mycena sanguinolenta]
MAVLGAGVTAPLTIRATNIRPTRHCIETVIPGITELTAIVPLINDTAIFLAINYRILAPTIVADSLGARLRVFFGGTGFSALSRGLIQSGQHFYLIAVATHITLLVGLKLPQLSPVYHGMVAVPSFSLINAMACLVFRRIKFGLISSDGMSEIPTISLSSDFHATAYPRSLPLHLRHTDPTTTDLGSNTTFPLEVRVQKETHGFQDGTGAEQEISDSINLA